MGQLHRGQQSVYWYTKGTSLSNSSFQATWDGCHNLGAFLLISSLWLILDARILLVWTYDDSSAILLPLPGSKAQFRCNHRSRARFQGPSPSRHTAKTSWRRLWPIYEISALRPLGPYWTGLKFWGSEERNKKKRGAKWWGKYWLVVEVKGTFVVLELIANICRKQDEQTEKTKLIEVDCLIHEAIDL